MKKKTIRAIASIVILAGVWIGLGGVMKGKSAQDKPKLSTAELWKKVEAAEKDGLPQTAIDHLKTIVALALEGNRESEALRALSRQLVLESVIEGNKPEARVVRIREEIDKAPGGLKPMLRVILAQWFQQYYSRNRWRFINRDATAGGIDEKDFTTWDLRRIYREIDTLYQDVLRDETVLKKTPIAVYRDFLRFGNQPPSLRPTLYDFVVFEAIDFYTAGEFSAVAPEDALVLEADSPVLGPAAEFLRYRPETTDVDSPKLRTLLLYQGLLGFHRGDSGDDRDVFLDADLQRLRTMRNLASGESASERYIERLKDIADKNPKSVFSSWADFLRASEIKDKGDLVQAYAVADRGRKAHPNSMGGKNCDALIAQITARDFNLQTERVVLPNRPSRMAVDYANITGLHFRAVKENFDSLILGKDAESLFWLNDDHIRRFLERKPAAEWSAVLPPTNDYQSRRQLVDLPALAPGFYRILASHDKDFGRGKNKIAVGSFWVADLGLIVGGAETGAGLDGTVVRNESGDPVPNADLILYEWDYRTTSLQKRAETQTDPTGGFGLPSADRGGNRILVAKDPAGAVVAESRIFSNYLHQPQAYRRTVFFTDRSLYRPGQTIRFKGICLSVDETKAEYKALARQRVQVAFRDANRQEIAVLNLVSNEFGSVSGVFTAPADRLTGAMTISVEDPNGSATVRVEEYKRPKFQAKIDVPDKEFRLQDEVAVPGEAMSYTGAPIDGALVKYRVVRETRYPFWWSYWSRGVAKSEAQEIAHGTIRTDELGKFVVSFKAKPDPSASVASQPVFTYSVTADVTDSTGETRSAQGDVRLGFTSIEAGLTGSDWQETGKPVVLSITTTTLNGKRAAAKGAVEVTALRGPARPVPADILGGGVVRKGELPLESDGADLTQTADWRNWPDGALAASKEFSTTAAEGPGSTLSFDLKPGAYKAVLRTNDQYGTAVESRFYFLVLDPAAAQFPVRVPFHAAARKSSVEPGETYEFLWGTGYDRGPVLIEIYRDGRRLKRYWTRGRETQSIVQIPVEEAWRGGFTVVASMVKENRYYRVDQRVSVPWSNKRLDLRWKTFRSKLRPGQAETWSLEIKGPKAEIRAAEMVASLYDASLDQFYPHRFGGISWIFRGEVSFLRADFTNRAESLREYYDDLNVYRSILTPDYAAFPSDITNNLFGYAYRQMKSGARPDMSDAVPAPMAAAREANAEVAVGVTQGVVGGVVGGVQGGVAEKAAVPPKVPEIDLSKVQARKNLDETAFFYPDLLSDKDGNVTLEFKMPEALTEWKFLGFAHTTDLLNGSIEASTVTQKELMVQPNPPRFLREGDVLEFTVKVTNMTEKEVRGAVELKFFDPRNEKSLDALLANANPKQSFVIPAKQSRAFSWPVEVADGLETAGFKAVAATSEFSDGEEGVVPVLSRSMLVRESLPLWISDKGERSFLFQKLVKSGGSLTLRNVSLTVQMASNPAWYAVQALPYLMEYPYECSEQTFNRLYANSLAQKIAGSDPKIRRIFDLWKGTPALTSNLEKNEDLKSVLLQESPWVNEAKSESQAKRNVGLLFDENMLSRELKKAFGKLADMQLADGSWPWFPGGRGNDYITLYILTGFGRLKNLGVAGVSQDLAGKAIGRLDVWIKEIYDDILKYKTQDLNHLSPTIALYLYARSFYLAERPIPAESRKAVDYFLAQGVKFWLELGHRQSQAHLALGLNRFGQTETAQKIMRSMKERSKFDEELGRYWAETELSWWWYRAPIETQAMMIEAFDEVMKDMKAVEECKIWLLKQKQTQDWKTTKATADAVYGLILRGTDMLASDAIVEVTLGGKKVEPEKVEAGTGFYEKRYGAAEVAAAMGEIKVRKTDKGIAWGGVHWQYLEDISKITPHDQNPLRLKKSVFVRRSTKKGPVIEPVSGALAVGDTLVIRIELRTDRDMEYVHMKDHRGSGLEPTNVLSRYKFQDGLAYYEATKDTATHFFIDYLPKGTYVFEYELRIQHRGVYQNGMAHIECMYAPEFNSHSESLKLIVK